MFDIKESGQKIACLRKERGMTQEELAEIIGVSSQAVSKWENGNAMPEVALLCKLAQLLDCSTDDILNPTDCDPHRNYIKMLLPYQNVASYTGSWWPRSMAFPAVMAGLKLFMGLEERRNYDHCQLNDDQEYILQSGVSTQAFGFSHYNADFLHDCFRIYGLDYKMVSTDDQSLSEVTDILKMQIQKGFPVIIQDKTNNAAFLFVTGIIGDGQKIKAHEFVEGFDEKNCNMNPYDMETMDNWLQPGMRILLLHHAERKNLEDICRESLHNYCLMMTDKWDKEEFVSSETPDSFRQFMGYGVKGYDSYIQFLQEGSLDGFFPQQCIYYESNYSTLSFLKMCKEYVKDLDPQSINSAITKYEALREHAAEILHIIDDKDDVTKTEAVKRKEIQNLLIRSKEIFKDAVLEVEKAVGVK